MKFRKKPVVVDIPMLVAEVRKLRVVAKAALRLEMLYDDKQIEEGGDFEMESEQRHNELIASLEAAGWHLTDWNRDLSNLAGSGVKP